MREHLEFPSLLAALVVLDPTHPITPEQPGAWFVHKGRFYYFTDGAVWSRPA